MPQHIFEVELPDKSILEIDAPEDTPVDAIKARAKQYIDTQAVKTQQAAKYPTAAEGGKPDLPWYAGYFRQNASPERSATEVAQDQAANVLKGIPQAVTGIPAAVTGLAKAGFDVARGKAGSENVQDVVKGATAPFTTPLRGAAAYVAPGSVQAPTDEEFAQAAQGAGAMLGAAELPNVASGVSALVKPPLRNAFNAAKSKLMDRPPLDAPSVNKWMDVPAKEVVHGANPGAQLLTDKLLGDTKAVTKTNVDSALAQVGQEMQQHLAAADKSGVTIDAQTPVYDAVAKATKRIGSPRDSTFQAQMNGIVDDIEGKFANLDKLTPSQAHALKVELGDSIKWKGEAYDAPANQAMVQIYRELNRAIKSNVPGIAPVQSRWGNLYVASKNLAEAIADDTVGKGTGTAAPVNPNLFDKMKAAGKKYGPPLAIGATGAGIFNELRK